MKDPALHHLLHMMGNARKGNEAEAQKHFVGFVNAILEGANPPSSLRPRETAIGDERDKATEGGGGK